MSFARAQGDVLVVGLNSDRSVRTIKGDEKPFYQAVERAQLLAALEMVDYVVVFDDPRAEQIAREVMPSILVKGQDWRGQPIDGCDFVEAHVGRVVMALCSNISTSLTIARLRQVN